MGLISNAFDGIVFLKHHEVTLIFKFQYILERQVKESEMFCYRIIKDHNRNIKWLEEV